MSRTSIMTRHNNKAHQALPLLIALAALTAGAPAAHALTETRSTAYVYDANGKLLREIVEPQDSNLCLVTQYTYDAHGYRSTTQQRNCNGSAIPGVGQEAAAPTGLAAFTTGGVQEVHEHPGVANATERKITTTNALGHQSVSVLDQAFGTPLSQSDTNGLTTRWRYDGLGRKTLEQRPDGTGKRWVYDRCVLASCAIAGTSASILYNLSSYEVAGASVANDAGTKSGPYSRSYHDRLDRVVVEESEGWDGAGTARAVRQVSYYDTDLRLDRKTPPFFVDQSVPNSGLALFDFDILNRPIYESQFDGGDTSLEHDGLNTRRVRLVVTAATVYSTQTRQTTTETRDVLGQVVKLTDTEGKVLTRTYTPWGDLASTTDPAGNTIRIEYDLRGRKKRLIDPDLGQWTYEYNALGQLVLQTDARQLATRIEYDLLGRMKRKLEPDQESRWIYDTAYADGTTACANAKGRLCEAQTLTGAGVVDFSRRHEYDSLGRTTRTTTLAAVAGATGTYHSDTSYDALGRVATRTYPGPDGQRLSVTHNYTTLGYLKSVSNTAGGRVYWRADQTDEQGNLTQQTYANGAVTTRSYDRMDRLLTSAAGAGNAVHNDTYGYDYLGNLRSRSDTRAGAILTHQYDYDNLNRLKAEARNGGGVSGTQTITWGYNDIGNITSRSDVGTFTYPAAGGTRPHAVSSVTGTVNGVVNPSYGYDANGNVLSSAGRTAAWTSFNLPATLTRGTNQFSWAYDTEHERVREHLRVNGTLTRSTVYVNPAAGAGLFYEEEVAGGVLKRRHYISGTEGAVLQITRQAGVADQERYWHKDHLGSTTVVTSETGAVVERMGYEPFGKRRQADGTTDAAGTLAGTSTDRGYTGHEMLDEVGLVHMNGRIYDPAIGRFLSADPNVPDPSDLQSHNRYSYVRNRPMSVTDPTGFWDYETGTSSFGIGSGMYNSDMPFGAGTAANLQTLPQGAGFTLGYDPVSSFNNAGVGFQAVADVRAIDDNKPVIPGREPGGDKSITAPPAHTPEAGNWFIAAANAVDHVQRNTELGRNLQAIPGEGQAAGTVKAGFLLIGKLLKTADAGADAARGITAGKRVNMPAWKKIAIDMEEVSSGHMSGGARLAPGNKKDVFAEGMTQAQIERAIRNAYRHGEVLKSQGADRVFVRGPFEHGSIEMWVNKTTKKIETAWPKF
jgi:RHS repeat-associated protein